MALNLKKQYDSRFSKRQEYRNKVWKTLIKSFFQKYIPSDSDILDLGCGWGEFINNIEGNKKFGMDRNPDTKNHLESSIEFINRDCSDIWPVPDETFDIIFTSNFFEHLPSKMYIEKTMIQVKRCLKPNGIFICLGPNIKYLPGRYWDFWDHNIGITELSLSEVLRMHDFSIEECLSKFIPYEMTSSRQYPIFLVKLYLAFPFLWRLFGKQFLIIARNTVKPS